MTGGARGAFTQFHGERGDLFGEGQLCHDASVRSVGEGETRGKESYVCVCECQCLFVLRRLVVSHGYP
jgi:hypothetical protein